MKRSSIGILREPNDFYSFVKTWVPLAVLVGLVTGVGMSVFYVIFLLVQELSTYVFLPVTMFIGGGITAVIIYFGGEKIEGSGVQYFIGTRRGKTEITLKDASLKLVASTAATGSGCIGGEEGPAVFIGGAIALYIAKLLGFPAKKRNMTVTIGGAAATSAIFQTPLGGAIFSLELPFRHDLDAPEYTPAFLASLISYFTFKGLMFVIGENPRVLSLHVERPLTSFFHLYSAVIIGVVTALVGVLFVRTYLFTRKVFMNRFSRVRAVITGISISSGLAWVFILVNGASIPFGGTGFRTLDYIELHPDISVWLLLSFIIFTIIINSLTIGSGVSAGVFGPALVVGGSVGAIVGLYMDPANISGFIIIGMSAGHTATTKTPIASLVLILELTNFPPLFLPMTIANVVAFFLSGENSIYEGQARDRFDELVSQIDELDVLAELTVKDMMTRNVITLKETTPIHVAKTVFHETGKHTIPVLGLKNKVTGVISIDDIQNMKEDDQPISMIMKKPITLKPEMTLKDALYYLDDRDVERAPVVNDQQELLGFLTLRDIIRTHRKYRVEHFID